MILDLNFLLESLATENNKHHRIVSNCMNKEIKGKKVRIEILRGSTIAYVLGTERERDLIKTIKYMIQILGTIPLYK